MTSLFLFVGIGVSTASAQADAIVRGEVVDVGSGVGVKNAQVTLTPQQGGSSQTVVTGSEGRFVFVGLRPGVYVVSARAAEGFVPREVGIQLVPRDVQSLRLAVNIERMAVGVNVVAEELVPSTHSPSSTMMTSDRLEEMPLASRTNLAAAIVTAAPGMIRGHDDFVHIRGHEVALNPTVNGVQFWENAHSMFSTGIGVDYIESLNVMTGGFPAEYGNRFGGILDVVTKSGSSLNGRGSILLGAGTAQRHTAGVEVGRQRGQAAVYLNVGGFTSDRFLSPPSPRAIHDTGRGLRSFGRIDVRVGSRNYVNVVATGDGVNVELPMEERDEQLRPDFKNVQRARSQSAILSWNHARSSQTLVEGAFYQRWSKVHQFPDTIDRSGAQTDSQRTLATVGLKGSVSRFTGRHTVKAGLDLVMLRPREDLFYLSQPWIDFTHLPEINESHVHLRGPNLGVGVPRPLVFAGEETGGQASAFVQDRIQVTSNLTIDAGVRVDRYSLAISESHVSPRVNAALRLTPGTVLFGSYNHFFVPPPVENILAGSAGLTRFLSEIGRPLPPVRAIKEDQIEAGITQTVAGIGTVGVTSYARLSDDPAHTSLFPDSRFYTYASFDKGKAYGTEARATINRIGTSGISGYVNYAFGRVWFYNPITAGFTTEAAHLTEVSRFLAPMDQTHTLMSGVTYRHSRSGVWGGLTMEYGSGTPGAHGAGDHEDDGGEAHEHAAGPGLCAERCPSRFTQNLSLGWAAAPRAGQPRWSLQLSVENVSNKVYLLSKESSMVQGQYSISRLVSGSVRLRF